MFSSTLKLKRRRFGLPRRLASAASGWGPGWPMPGKDRPGIIGPGPPGGGAMGPLPGAAKAGGADGAPGPLVGTWNAKAKGPLGWGAG